MESYALVLPDIISPNQSAFIHGREIMDNILICQDLMRLYNRRICSPRIMMKIDLKKAYDSIEWSFVEDMLVALKVPDKMVTWIMQCVTTPSYTLALNGSHFGYFKGGRGLRQGDPLSPLLFTICLEYLTRILNVVTLRHDFRFHPMCRGLGLCQLAFADDLLLFSRGDTNSVMVLMRALHTFSIASGLTINKLKSDIYMNGLNYDHQAQILAISGFKKWARIYLLPKGIIQKVDSICRNYLWSGKDGYHRVPAVSWERCCQSKLYGGLGINNSHVWNIASIGKYSWWVANKMDSLWVKWIHHLYIKQQDWWNYSPNINSSWVWRQICKVKDKLKACLDYQNWLLSPYSTQKTYDCLMGTREKARWIPFVWNRVCLPKVNFINWLYAQNRLLTKVRLLKFGVISDGVCCLFIGLHSAKTLSELTAETGLNGQFCMLGVPNLDEQEHC
ncbi:uncharacterized protein LOC141613310 [Silene latifolia]|uniref:uncharacterized protein LOC141613310 n=1 Tax=Silene latifolia TaxID=37657 RepID=UPI003D773E84